MQFLHKTLTYTAEIAHVACTNHSVKWQRKRSLRGSRAFKVTDFGTNRKPIYATSY